MLSQCRKPAVLTAAGMHGVTLHHALCPLSCTAERGVSADPGGIPLAAHPAWSRAALLHLFPSVCMALLRFWSPACHGVRLLYVGCLCMHACVVHAPHRLPHTPSQHAPVSSSGASARFTPVDTCRPEGVREETHEATREGTGAAQEGDRARRTQGAQPVRVRQRRRRRRRRGGCERRGGRRGRRGGGGGAG